MKAAIGHCWRAAVAAAGSSFAARRITLPSDGTGNPPTRHCRTTSRITASTGSASRSRPLPPPLHQRGNSRYQGDSLGGQPGRS